VGIPARETNAAVRQSFVTLGLGLLLSIAVGAGASLMMARLVRIPILQLRRAAQAVGRGEVPDVEPMRIAEINDVAQALVGAARARKQAENAREEILERERIARSAAEAASRSKDEFLAMLGHELRNPLSAISTAASVIDAQQTSTGTPDATKPAQRVIVRQVEHLARLVDDLLDVARVVSGKVLLERGDVDVPEVVKQSIATLKAGGQLDHHVVDVNAEQVWVHGDPTRLQQVVDNLVVNAVKYTPIGGHIQVTVRTSGGQALLEVSDDGDGISPKLLSQVFELFTQGERALDRSQGGLGIGLTLVRRLVELHGGKVSAKSRGEGQGSVFTVKLPTISQRESADSIPEAPSPSLRHVVIVEDNPDSREMLEELLRIQGHRVDVAVDGPQGLERVMSERPEVALVDLGLPGFDGYELARRLRAAPENKTLMLVALSGYGSEQDKKRSRAAGFDLHLVKPVSSEALSRVLTQVARGRSAQ
jgi:signal transduction histidine kinase/CheY-like chemotaxis protein